MPTVDFQRNRAFFVGIDSDGGVFDSMELKHKASFIPPFIKHDSLQGVRKHAREVAEFGNLSLTSRRVNQFLGPIEQLDWLRRRPEVIARGVEAPNPEGRRRWLATESEPDNAAVACRSGCATSPTETLRSRSVSRHER